MTFRSESTGSRCAPSRGRKSSGSGPPELARMETPHYFLEPTRACLKRRLSPQRFIRHVRGPRAEATALVHPLLLGAVEGTLEVEGLTEERPFHLVGIGFESSFSDAWWLARETQKGPRYPCSSGGGETQSLRGCHRAPRRWSRPRSRRAYAKLPAEARPADPAAARAARTPASWRRKAPRRRRSDRFGGLIRTRRGSLF